MIALYPHRHCYELALLRRNVVIYLLATGLGIGVVSYGYAPRSATTPGDPITIPPTVERPKNPVVERFKQDAERFQWAYEQPPYAVILDHSRTSTGIDELVYQVNPNRYLWAITDIPQTFSAHAVEVEIAVRHSQQFLAWLLALQTSASVWPVECEFMPNSVVDPGVESEYKPTRIDNFPTDTLDSSKPKLDRADSEFIQVNCRLLWLWAKLEEP